MWSKMQGSRSILDSGIKQLRGWRRRGALKTAGWAGHRLAHLPPEPLLPPGWELPADLSAHSSLKGWGEARVMRLRPIGVLVLSSQDLLPEQLRSSLKANMPFSPL